MNSKKQSRLFWICTILVIVLALPAQSQRKRSSSSSVQTLSFDESLYSAVQWRSIGPFRGGRSAAVTGVSGKPNLFYFGSTGGGVWRTIDGGNSWENISDGYFGGSIGAVAVSEYDNNVIYVGGGEKTVRGNVSSGSGLYKSMDAGETWQEIGLKNSRHVARIRIHPKNPDHVYAAVMGDLYKSSDERGVYRSKDGGNSWDRILFANADAGAVDLIMDPNNPRILYASTWRIRRTPYSLESGGEGSNLWKSTDGGDTWKNISGNEGLPDGLWGISGVTISPVNSKRVWALIENKDGGVYRSDDGGETWRKINSERKLRQRAWYYTRIYADTKDVDKVYVLNVGMHASKDGGKTFETRFRTPHGDHHDLWIAPEDPNRLIVGDDGGAQISYSAGTNWTTYMNQPTSQFYRVTTDNHFPYRIYGAQQDNSTVRIAHRTNGGSITESDWESSAGGESAHLAPHPINTDIVYGGSYGGLLSRVDHSTGQSRVINVWPNNPMGHGAENMKYRFQWNFPIFFSPHDPNKLYTASNYLHVTTDEGQSWEVISPDLTRNDPTKLGPSGGPITKDNTAVEYYCTIFAAVESPYEEGLIWTGSDDGLIQVTRDGGANWENVTPAGMPEWVMINSIDPDPFVKGGAYVAGTRYKMGDYQPYLYKTKDYGKTWIRITNGINAEHFTRVVRADPKRQGLLYSGTESGMYISFDDGAKWQPFKLNLPIVPITDLTIKNDNLIAATQGRSFWLIDDLTPIHQLNNQVVSSSVHLFKPMPSYRMGGGGRWGGGSPSAGQNHPGGVMVYYNVKNLTDSTEVALEFMESDGTLIKKYSSSAKKRNEKIEVEKGSNMFNWNMRYPDAEGFDGLIMWAAGLTGPKAVPGTYKVKLTVDDQSMETDFEILKDPRSESSIQDLQMQHDFLISVRDKVTEMHKGIKDIRDVKKQISGLTNKISDDEFKDLVEEGKRIIKELSEIEETLYQTKNQSGQDPLNFPIRLNNKLAHLSSVAGRGDYPPTSQTIGVREELTQQIDEQMNSLQKILETDVPEFNRMVRDKGVNAIITDVVEPVN
jgi:photosystem II stability/assembly factor-like uncharacterized protein